MMKKHFIVVVVHLALITNCLCFLNFPFDAESMLDDFLHALHPPQFKNNSNIVVKEVVDGEKCNRACEVGEVPKMCYFKWTMEFYSVMGGACNKCSAGNENDCFHPQCVTADGFERGLMSINRQLPGPTIRVCKNDFVIVDLTNEMDGTSTSIHWHGISQKNTPFMDGVPFLTQCPIEYGTSFRYKFQATDTGTHFYHSHAGHQKANGAYGALIVQEPKSDDPNKSLYDLDLPEHVIFTSDWMHNYAEMFVPGLPSTSTNLRNILINGKSRFNGSMTPLAVFSVEKGKNYRFRFINSASMVCPFEMKIEKHRMKLIATEVHAVKPVHFDTAFATSGERFDFVLEANQKEGEEYWIRVRAVGPCKYLQIEAFAVLTYNKNGSAAAFTNKTMPSFTNDFPKGVFFNNPKSRNSSRYSDDLPITELESYLYDQELVEKKADSLLFLNFMTPILETSKLFSGDNTIKFMTTSDKINENRVGVINNISFTFPSFPLLTQSSQINENMFCSEPKKNTKCPREPHCFCTHRLKFKLNSIIEMVIIDIADQMGELIHPFHLHGHHFIVTEIGTHPENMTVENQKLLPAIPTFGKRDKAPPYKDNIIVPNRGFVKIKFRADNPGFWLLHCHLEWHLAIGMGLVVQVGEIDEMVKPPKDFPKCGNYMPEIKWP